MGRTLEVKKNSAWNLYEALSAIGFLIPVTRSERRRARWDRPHQGERECARRRRQMGGA